MNTEKETPEKTEEKLEEKSEQSENPQPAEIPTVADAEIEARIAAAREEGRIAGRNELLAEQMSAPSLWEIAAEELPDAPADDSDDLDFLKTVRPCVWD